MFDDDDDDDDHITSHYITHL